MRKKLLFVLGGLFILFFGWRVITLILRNPNESTGRSGRPPVAVEVDSVRIGAIRDVRQYTGTVHALYQYVVAPKVTGRIVQINKRIGDWVKKNEVIARVDDAEYQQAVAEAEANLKIAQASLAEAQSQFTLAKQELERVRSLQEKGIASPSELDASQTNYTAQQSRLELATAQVQQREAALKSAQIRLNYTVLVASQPGFIGERYVDEGALLAPNAPVASVIGIDTVIVRTTIIERDYGRIQIGQPADVAVDAFPGQSFTGKVSRIAPMLQEESRMAQMELVVENGDLLLKPGMFARVNVVVAEKDSAQIVPTEAIVDHGSETGVFVVERSEPIAKYLRVVPGIASNRSTEIITPKINGLVITLGQHLLDDGSPVILPKQKATHESQRPDSSGKES
jgi:RND family efflux transporter MFP subunit